ncbi:hypothetical protein [Aliiglaciecola sp. LCG003]|uniref:hypothetical protein n=1 Tax=Aliiglaciecola sp. LCG003 TaxID=3053655 RepID=UPI002572520C|nr:hypothetical protein [Aliiglaciecola sp. LCG003]WJG09262.1 hypothetical protein QR722_18325 [Aliiglaciecola sp. LCG003]
MIYALNLYDIVEGEEDTYRQYVKLATQQLIDLDARPVCSGTNPVRSIKGNSRQHMLVMEFANQREFDRFMSRLKDQKLHMLRDTSTENHIWTLYENWNLKHWVNKTRAN